MPDSVIPDDEYFVIEHNFRTIRIPSKKKLLGVVNDANVNTIHFKAPRYYGSTDLSTFEFQINFVNAHGDEDVYPVDDLAVSSSDSNVLEFTWLVGRVACLYEGEVEFSIRAYLMEDDEIGYEYYTLGHTLQVVPTIVAEAAVVMSEYPDAIQQLVDRIIKLRAEVTFGEGMDVDSELSITSDNPVRNKVITQAMSGMITVSNGVLTVSV